MQPDEVIIHITLGIGDLVFIEPGIRLLLQSGYKTIHLFCRSDGMNLYHAYPGVQVHPLGALKGYKPEPGIQTIRIDRETHIGNSSRITEFTLYMLDQVGADTPIPEYITPELPVGERHIKWAETYLKPVVGQEIIVWQMESSRWAKSLPRATCIEAINQLLAMGKRVLVLSMNHRGFPRHENLKLLRGLSMERFMAVCSLADKVVGLDSSPSWIGGAVGTSTIAIFGPTDPALFCPQGEHYDIARLNGMCPLQPCGNVVPGCKNRVCMDIPPEVLVMKIIGKWNPEEDMLVGDFTNKSTKSSIGIGKELLLPGETQRIIVSMEFFPAVQLLMKRGMLAANYDVIRGKTPQYVPKWDAEIKHIKPQMDSIGILGLEGMGGTIALSDIAQKVKQKYDKKITMVIRNYQELFDDNPYVDEVIQVGAMDFAPCLVEYCDKFYAVVDIRFALGKWYGNISNKLSSAYELLYERHPIGQASIGDRGMHYLQVISELLGLPSDNISSRIYFDLGKQTIDGDYVVITNGVDIWHRGMRQTKCWPYWNRLVELLPDTQFVQLGTNFDLPVKGVTDMRGMTGLKEMCSIMKHAYAIIVTEGGLMHMAYALDCEKVIVLRGPTASPLLAYPGQICVDSVVCRACMFSTDSWFQECPKGMQEPTCMYSITPERVAMTYENMVSE